MVEFDNIFIRFIYSYITDVTILRESDNNSSMLLHIEGCYKRALKLWSGNDDVRGRMALHMFPDMNRLCALFRSNESDSYSLVFQSLIALWAQQLSNDEECVKYIEGLELSSGSAQELLIGAIPNSPNDATRRISRGLISHKQVDGYIRRYCSSSHTESNYIYYMLGTKERYTLTDYVVGVAKSQNNKFILYSSAQTGKTTELKQLCYELQQSGLYVPVSLEVRNNTKLQRGMLPDFKYIDNKEVVVVIDALDEVNGKKYDDILEEIAGYAYDHPEMKIVLSCRSNYRRENRLRLFSELFLEELSVSDATIHIDNVLGKGNGMMNYIRKNQLSEFIKNPFFLNVLIDAYRVNNRKLPQSKAELYRLFIDRSYKVEGEEKSVSLGIKHSLEDSIFLLERVALTLSLMNVQTISKDELLKSVYDDKNNVEEILRYDLIQCEGGRYSFKHNAFREWLVSNYLSRMGLDKAKQLSTHPNGRVKPEWYNIIMLWLSMYGKDRKNEISAILGWLKDSSLELIIYIDRDMLDEKTRDEVFKGILLEYRSLGIRISNIMSHDYQDLLSFSQTEDVVDFIADELAEADIDTAYYVDLICLCYFMNWEKLYFQNKELTRKLFNTLLSKSEKIIAKENVNDMHLFFLGNKFFSCSEFLEPMFELLKTSQHSEVIKTMIGLIDDSGMVDEYIDYILEYEKYVHNIQRGNTTHVVSRSIIYSTLSKLNSIESIKRVFAHKLSDPHRSYHTEKKEYFSMIENLLAKIVIFIQQGHKELSAVIEEYAITLFKNYYYHLDSDNEALEHLKKLRNYYLDAGLREQGRSKFYKRLSAYSSTQKETKVTYEHSYQTFTMAVLWITTEDVKSDFDKFSPQILRDSIIGSWYCSIPLPEIAEYAKELNKKIFPEPERLRKSKERQLAMLNDFANYEVFKQMVLEMVAGLDERTTRKEHRKRLLNVDSDYNQYALRFLSHYELNNDRYHINAIITNIKDKNVYECFFTDVIASQILSDNPHIPISEDIKSRCIDIAQSIVVALSSGKFPGFGNQVALQLMLYGYFEIPISLLPLLIDYGKVSISKIDNDNYFSREYTLWEYIAERVDITVLAALAINKLKENIDNDSYSLSYALCNYIIENCIECGYNLVFQCAVSNHYWANNILDLLIKNGIKIDQIKNEINEMQPSHRMSCYSSLATNGEEEWVKMHLESEYQKLDIEHLSVALKLLTSIGSVDALNYLCSHTHMLNNSCNYHFNYDSTQAIPSLCYFIKYYVEHSADDYPFAINSILASLERIATKDKESLTDVKCNLSQLAQMGARYKYLNRYIINFENKFYASHSGVTDIDEVLLLIDTSISSSKENGDIEALTLSHDDYVYISYSWEGHSQHIVNHLCMVLDTKGIPYKRDKKDCTYNDNIKEFMNSIRNGKIVIVVIGKNYLYSHNCMYELSGVLENVNFEERILPVIMDDNIRTEEYYEDLANHWKKQLDNQKSLVKQLKKHDASIIVPEQNKLNEIEQIYKLLGTLKEYIDWVNVYNIDDLSATNFAPIIKLIKEKMQKLKDCRHSQLSAQVAIPD